MRTKAFLALLACGCLSANAAYSAVFTATNFSEFSSAITSANAIAGSTIYLAPGEYSGGALPSITASLTIALDPSYNAQAGSAILNTSPTASKGLLTVQNNVSAVNLTVDGLTFENAAISAGLGGNAAGIRYQGGGMASLNVSNSFFLNNQNGILTGDGGAVETQLLDITIANSLFANNGAADGFEHAIYAFGRSLAVSNSTFCGTVGGHDIKSRTAVTTVTNSTLYDGAQDLQNAVCNTGSSSYALDAPNGGQVTVNGTSFIQGDASPNHAIVSYGEEGLLYALNALVIQNSAFTSTLPGIGIQEPLANASTCPVPVQLSNTTFRPGVTQVSPSSCASQVTPPPDPIDEPSTLGMLMAMLLGGAWIWSRRRPPLLQAI